MQAPKTQNVYELFNNRIQFVVPPYQRAYVWSEDENWTVMWEDIEDTADHYLEEPAAHVQYRHFLGPVVLNQQYIEPGGVDPRLVIDGQQRLTTLQVILSATASVAREENADDVADDLLKLTVNDGLGITGDLRVKVWPSKRDRAAFLAVMGGDAQSADTISKAWRYFRQRIKEWVTDSDKVGPEDRKVRIKGLRTCLISLLYVVSINLDESDNAQVIFETLNARGTGLGALDLVKNATFLQAEEEEQASAEVLYEKKWEPTFEADDYWLEETRQGREKRARADWFLMHWLAMELGVVVRSDKLFDTFRKDVLRRPSRPAMTEFIPQICADAKTMRSFDQFEQGSAEELFFSRMQALDTTTMFPVALLLFRTESLSAERRLKALRALESWLVRRAILRLTAKNYNRTLTSLLEKIKERLSEADVAVVEELRSSQADTAIWPSDPEVRSRLENGDLYTFITQARVRMLLEACELDVRDPAKTEPIPLPGGLTIEHAMPQSWEEFWPVPANGDQEILKEQRAAHINRLGNLTLVTQPLNSALSKDPWVSPDGGRNKRTELGTRSVLLINQQLCQNEVWNEDLIDNRGRDFTDRILRTWPGPDSPVWT